MKRMLWGLALAFVTSAFAQQQSPTNQPPYSTPPTFPESRAPRQQMPPDTKAPPPQGSSAALVKQQIQDQLKSEPALANTKIGVKTNDKSVTLTGSVDTERQHDLAFRIAQSYAADRQIVDKIKVRGRA
jgi:hypothetical protein